MQRGAVAAAKTERPRALSPHDVVQGWGTEGPLIHEPTGIARLDELTGGGPVYGSRWYWLGAPDAGKTAELVQVADIWARRGVVVGFLAIDEEPSDITTRLAQRAKFSRVECETREEGALREMCEALKDLPIRLYGPEWTIEDAAEHLAAYAKVRSAPASSRMALFVDSIQQATCSAVERSDREISAREVVNANVRALRSVATMHRLIAMATSEMNRNAYKSIEAAEQSNDMAAGAESRAIEFSSRVMLSLRSVKDEKDLSVIRIVKNKHGPSGEELYRRIDRRHMALEDAPAPDVPDADQVREQRTQGKVRDDAKKLLTLIAHNPGIGSRKLRERSSMGPTGIGRALDLLVEEGSVENRPQMHGTREDPHYFAVSAGEEAR